VIDAGGRPVGVVSEDDLLLKELDPVRHSAPIFGRRKRREEQEKAAAVNASVLMTTPAITVTPGTPVRDAARLMHENPEFRKRARRRRSSWPVARGLTISE
jgi:CBS domain-containing protein